MFLHAEARGEVGSGGRGEEEVGGLKAGRGICLGNYSSARERRKVTLH